MPLLSLTEANHVRLIQLFFLHFSSIVIKMSLKFKRVTLFQYPDSTEVICNETQKLFIASVPSS